MKPFQSALLILLIFLSACSKKEEVTPVSITPTINLTNVSSYSVNEGDPITFKIFYKDGDGDIGENSTNATNLFLVDNRINITYEYRVQQLAPTGANITIEGNLDVLLKSTSVINPDTSKHTEQVTYSIYLKDRAGHQSNTVSTSAITVKR